MVRMITQSLIDRLADDGHGLVVESEAQALERYKLGLRRDLENLLNSKRPLLPAVENDPELEGTILSFGLRDISTEDFSASGTRDRVRRMIIQCIHSHEPRLSNVDVEMDDTPTSRGMRFRITAQLTLVRGSDMVVYDAGIQPNDRSIAVELSS